MVYSKVKEYFLENPENAKAIIAKISLTYKSRQAALQAKENTRRKTVLDNMFNLPGKLTDCQTKNNDIAELFLVEGDSAGGSAKMGRDRYFQAILPLKGKVLNVEKVHPNKVYANNEILSIFTVIGTDVKEKCNLSKIRYNKIIIMTDADVDGSHIKILLLTLFYRYLKPLIKNGNVYLARPPLYKVQQNKKIKYCYSEFELNNIKKELESSSDSKIRIQRYKGLGEMNPDQLWETTMNPENRIISCVSIEDATDANNICETLMGDNIEERKNFIKSNAKYTKNLDI